MQKQEIFLTVKLLQKDTGGPKNFFFLGNRTESRQKSSLYKDTYLEGPI